MFESAVSLTGGTAPCWCSTRLSPFCLLSVLLSQNHCRKWPKIYRCAPHDTLLASPSVLACVLAVKLVECLDKSEVFEFVDRRLAPEDETPEDCAFAASLSLSFGSL